MEKVDLVITNAKELVTLKGPSHPRIREEMNDLHIVKNGSVAVDNGKIIDVGKKIEYKGKTTINAKEKTVLPGFVDPHTHVVFAGTREFELDMKLQGYSYMDILQKGGGIFYTVNKTRQASTQELLQQATKRLNTMLSLGTTSCEAKSGYGLDTKTELKILQVQNKLNTMHPIDISSTFLGAHAIPKNKTADGYIDYIIREMLPEVKKHAQFCDVFCEKGVFSVEQSKALLLAAKQHGLTPKIHADEIVDTGGAALAAEIDAISADHLLRSNKKGLQEMAAKNIMGVLLPGTPFSLMMNEYAPARTMIDLGVPVALATDLNPNCYTENMQFMIQLACLRMKMTPAEAICAATYNAACAIDKHHTIGSIEKGKQADVILLDCPSHQHIPYHFGVNLVSSVIKKGQHVL